MKIKYSKFEINMWDIFFLVICLSHLLGGIDILFNKKEKVGIIFLVIGISYFVYRFLLVMIIKSKMKFDFSDYKDKRVLIRGCSDVEIPTNAYVGLVQKLKPMVKSLMFGEACSSVPIYKK